MYFQTETEGEVTTIKCCISGRYWKYHNQSQAARQHAVSSATSFQTTLIGTLVNEEHLNKTFHTLNEIEEAYARYDAKRTSTPPGPRGRWVP